MAKTRKICIKKCEEEERGEGKETHGQERGTEVGGRGERERKRRKKRKGKPKNSEIAKEQKKDKKMGIRKEGRGEAKGMGTCNTLESQRDEKGIRQWKDEERGDRKGNCTTLKAKGTRKG